MPGMAVRDQGGGEVSGHGLGAYLHRVPQPGARVPEKPVLPEPRAAGRGSALVPREAGGREKLQFRAHQPVRRGGARFDFDSGGRGMIANARNTGSSLTQRTTRNG